MGNQTKIILILSLILITIVAVEGSEEKLKVVPANEILAKIQKGDPVEYNHVIIKGDLNLNQLNLSNMHLNRSSNAFILGLSENVKIINSSIKIINSTLDGNITSLNNIFYSPVDFSGCNFTKPAVFDADVFSVPISESSEVSAFSGGAATFDNARFYMGADFSGASGLARFLHTRFDKTAMFWGAQLYDPDFAGAQFINEYTDFRNAQFVGLISFSGAQFSNAPIFDDAQFNGDTYFIGTIFGGEVSFYWVQFDKNVDFTYAKFGGDADFSDAKFKGYITGWSYLESFIKCNEETYLALIGNLKDHGQFIAADDCYYAYRFNYMHSIIDYLSWLSCGFGVRWSHTIGFAVLIWILFALFYYIWGIHSLKGPLAFSAVALLSLPKEIYGDDDEYKKLMDKYLPNILYLGIINKISFRVPFVLERLIGWGLLILLVNTLSRLMIRY